MDGIFHVIDKEPGKAILNQLSQRTQASGEADRAGFDDSAADGHCCWAKRNRGRELKPSAKTGDQKSHRGNNGPAAERAAQEGTADHRSAGGWAA